MEKIMQIRVEIDKEYVGMVKYQLGFFSLSLVASEFTTGYAILYFDVPPKTIHSVFISNESWQNSFMSAIQDISKNAKHFNIAFAESTSSLFLPHYQTLDDEDIFIEAMFPQGSVYSLKSIIDIHITIVNQSADDLIIVLNNGDICTLSILDCVMREQKCITSLKSSLKPKGNLILKPEENYSNKIQFKLHMKNIGYYYFVIQIYVRSVNTKTSLYACYP